MAAVLLCPLTMQPIWLNEAPTLDPGHFPACVQFRVLFANIVALFWSIFLLQRAKRLANNTVKQKKEQDKE